MSTNNPVGNQQKNVDGSGPEKKKTCFVVTPIGADPSTTRRATDGLFYAVLKPMLESKGFTVDVAHKMDNPGSITYQVVNKVINSDLVVANLTELNPNVMYELAIRHCVARPLIVLAEKGTKLPFDVAAERSIFYLNDMRGAVDLAEELGGAIDSAMLETTNSDNPVYRALGRNAINEELIKNNPQDAKLINVIIKKLDSIEAKYGSIVGDGGGKSLNNDGFVIDFWKPRQDSLVEVFEVKNGDMDDLLRILDNWAARDFEVETISSVENDSTSILIDPIVYKNLSRSRIMSLKNSLMESGFLVRRT